MESVAAAFGLLEPNEEGNWSSLMAYICLFCVKNIAIEVVEVGSMLRAACCVAAWMLAAVAAAHSCH
jgi:hypothetical protein